LREFKGFVDFFAKEEEFAAETDAFEFLEDFCIQDQPGLST